MFTKPHVHIIMTQTRVRARIEKFRHKCRVDLLNELHPLHSRDTLLPERNDELSNEEKKISLRYLMFIKEKWDHMV